MIVFLCTWIGYPNGTAPTGRITAYSKGMVCAGEEVYILLLDTSEYGENPLNHQVKGSSKAIAYEYTCGTPFRGRTFLQRRWLSLKGVLIATQRLLEIRSKKDIEALLLYPDLPFTTLWFWAISRILRVPLLLEKSEHPFLNRGDQVADRLYKFVYTKLILWRFDGVIVISNYLERYLRAILQPRIRIIRIPILVDSIFLNESMLPSLSESRNITYCGLLNEEKDGVLTLMRAFGEIYRDYPDLSLRLIGDSYKESKIAEYRMYAQEMGIAERVDFVGMIERDQLPGYLHRASILALARPSSLQASAGFPSKIGEYLASGKPVVATLTGELGSYLEDGVNIFFSEPDNYQKFAARLRYALDHPEEAQEIGMKGQKIAHEYFDSTINMQRLVEFIRSFSHANSS